MKLYADLANGGTVEIKVTTDDIEQQIRQLRGDEQGAAHRWVEAEDGSWIQVSQIARLVAAEEGGEPFVLTS